MRKYSLIILFIVVAAAGLLWGCIESFKEDRQTINGSDEEVRIGLNLELTGPLESYGIEQAMGALMAFEEINRADELSGITIVPFRVDNQSDAVRSAFLSNLLMTQEGVAAVIGPATSNNFIAAIPAAVYNEIPIVSATATADTITIDRYGDAYDYVFRITFTDSVQGKSMANFAINNLEAKNAVILRDLNSVYSEDLVQNFVRIFRENGGTIVDLINYTGNGRDFEPIVNRIKREDFDVIYMPGYYQDAGDFIKQARELGITKPILGGDAYDSPMLAELAGTSALNNVYYTSGYSPLDQNPLTQDFIVDYREKYGRDPNAFSAFGYDAARFVADAIQRAGSGDPEAIRNAMASTENFPGVTGMFSIGEDHNSIKQIYVIKLENGVPAQSIVVEPIE
ncbi:ABC transporter substrate-binding protein [Clostridium aminobutyricum]|uniref:ABC transporter substrate-binding protein n=1 Tax=Clostridium aminobutyricum TaxID=33953 RepID=A0A939IIP8_CLOAM|nr:ABC transporter substrate-binding protein [Clostridium aminobutyricum]MBN7772724.1 ABC transporter substrate-binding protein [Clostridium aminobutyricum]